MAPSEAFEPRALRKRRLFSPSPTTELVSMGRAEIEQILPHRGSFLFVDLVTHRDAGARVVCGRRTIDPKDPVFDAHFPGDPVYPGVLLLETMGQLGICAIALLDEGRAQSVPAPVRALRVHDAWFLAEVRPGDALELSAKVVEADAYRGTCVGQILKRDGTIAAVAQMEVYFVE